MIENINKYELFKAIQIDMENDTNVFNMVLNAYNTLRGDEYDYSDYIYNLDKKDDLMACVGAGLTAKEINAIYELTKDNNHFCVYNNGKLETILDENVVVLDILKSSLYELINYILLYPWIEDYKALYTKYVTNPNLD